MRKLAPYRRNAAPNSGLKERAVWQLIKGPKIGRELSALFHMSLGQFNSIMRGCLRGETSVITETDPVPVGGCADFTSTLVSNSRVTPAARKKCSSAAGHLQSVVDTSASKTSSQPKNGRASSSATGIKAAWTNYFPRH